MRPRPTIRKQYSSRSQVALCILLLTVVGAGLVYASGFPPVANDDLIVVVRGGTTSVLADGSTSVVANDFDPENDRVIAFLTRNTRRGELVFFNDGRFIYQHGGGRRRDDEFRYILYDGTGFSNEAKVDIEVVDGDPVPPQIVGQDEVAVNEDSSRDIDIRSLDVVDPDNDFPDDFTLEVSDGENYTRQGIEITPTANFNGELSVPVRVFDGENFSNVFSLVVDVVPRNDAPFVVGNPGGREAIENERFNLALANYFDDVDNNDVLRFSATGLPGSRRLVIDPNSGVLSGTPSAGDVRNNPYSVTVTATDLSGARASLQFLLTVFPDNRADLTVSAAVSVNPVTVGQTAQWNIVVENLGPADVEEGELVAQWSSSGPALSLSAPQNCTISANNSSNPIVRCSLNGLVADASQNISIQGTQNGDGDNSLIAVAIADDPINGNNSMLVGAQVVAEFSEGPTQILGVSGFGICSGDLNNDGAIDIAVTADETVVFFNSGNRTVVTPGTSLGADSGGAAVVMLDWNGDSILDVAVAGLSNVPARVYLNDGNGNFNQDFDLRFSNAGNILAAATADFDANGFDDIVLTGTGGSWLLRSSGQSSASRTTLPAGAGIDVSVANINSDEFPDIVIVRSGDRAVRVLRNSGNGRNYSTQSLQRGSVASATGADLDGDGDTDLLLAIDGMDLNPPQSLILYQRSDGSFPSGESIGASPLLKMLAGDVDGDATNDIVALNEAGVHQLYSGDSSGAFALNRQQIVSSGMRGGILTDFNGDGSLDLILAGPASNVVEIHANNGIGILGLGDRNPPLVRLNGDANVSIPAGGFYEDPGATATDDIDGDLSDAVTVSGSFDTTVVGTYTLSYLAADRAGNQGSATRVIQVGVNAGTGGGGGGSLPLVFVALLLLVYTTRIQLGRFRRLSRAR